MSALSIAATLLIFHHFFTHNYRTYKHELHACHCHFINDKEGFRLKWKVLNTQFSFWWFQNIFSACLVFNARWILLLWNMACHVANDSRHFDFWSTCFCCISVQRQQTINLILIMVFCLVCLRLSTASQKQNKTLKKNRNDLKHLPNHSTIPF